MYEHHMRFYEQFWSYVFAKEQYDLSLKGKLNPKLKYSIACMDKQGHSIMLLKNVSEGKTSFPDNPNSFGHFFDTWKIWDFQVKFASRITPRKPASSTISISKLFKIILGLKWSFFCLGLKIIKLVFFKLIDSLLAESHTVKLSNSPFTWSIRNGRLLCEKNKFVSSGNKMRLAVLETLLMSLM